MKLTRRIRIAAILAALLTSAALIVPSTASAAPCTDNLTVGAAAASSQLDTTTWPATNIYDGNLSTSWSSNGHYQAPNSSEWVAYWFTGYAFHDVNFVRLRPRLVGSPPSIYGFPVTLTVHYSNGSQWIAAPGGTFTTLPAPERDEVILPFSSTVSTNGIYITASVLGQPFNDWYYFQLAEAGAGCTTSPFTEAGTLWTRATYDYAPSTMVDGSVIKYWWCSMDETDSHGDGIYYRTWNGTSFSTPQLVLNGTSGTWDAWHTCDPSVVKGTFSVGGSTYTYAMYYTGTDQGFGAGRVGVAFSNDGIAWTKYSGNPIISPAVLSGSCYGAGMPTFHRTSGTNSSGTIMFWDDTVGGSPSDCRSGSTPKNMLMTTSNGYSFSGLTAVNNSSDVLFIGDIAYIPAESKWYVATGWHDVVRVYKTATSSLTSTWTQVGTAFGPGHSDNPRNHNPGFQRTTNGDISIAGTTKYFLYGGGGTDPNTWDIHLASFQ